VNYKEIWDKLTTKLQEDNELLNKISQDCFAKTPEQIIACNTRMHYNNILRYYTKELENK